MFDENRSGLSQVQNVGQRRLQAFTADPVRCFPYQDHRCSHGLVVDSLAIDLWHHIVGVAGLSQQPDAVLAMVTRNRDELFEHSAVVLLR